MLSVPLTAEMERRLAELAKSRGTSDAELARDLLEASIEEIGDTVGLVRLDIELSERDSIRVLELLETPPAPPPRLVRAAKAVSDRG